MKNLWRFLKALLGVSILFLLVLMIYPTFLRLFRRYPMETLIAVGIPALSGLAIVFYVWELVLIGWVMDFLLEIGVPKIQALATPLEHEQVGEITIVTLHDNIATVLQCQFVQKQLAHLIDEHRCNFILDFARAWRISRYFREVMMHLTKAARQEAVKLGKSYRPVAVTHGAVFRVFADRERAINEMSRHDGHGWVVLCSVPAGVRAVSDLT